MGGWVAMQLAIQHPEKNRSLGAHYDCYGYRPNEGAIHSYVEPHWAANLSSSIEVLNNPSYDNIRTRMTRILAAERLTDEAIQVRQSSPPSLL